MSTRYLRKHLLHSTPPALLVWLLLATVDCRAQAPQLPAPTEPASRQPAPVRIENIVPIVGFDDKRGHTGALEFGEAAMTIDVDGHSTAIPLRSILAFSIVRDDKPLIRGTKGKLAQSAPYGVGFAVTMTRPTAESLTLFYRDSDGGIHGCVLALPKDTGGRVVSALAPELSPTDYPKTGDLVPLEPRREPGSQTAPASGPAKPSVVVTLPSESVDLVPSAFPAAMYEDLIEQLTQSGLFAHVWRAGDMRRTPDAMVLHLDIENWKKGSARGRGFGPFTGTTSIKSSVTLVDASGRTVFQDEVQGAKRTSGENLEATNSLAKHVRKALKKAPGLQLSRPGDK